MDRGTGGTGNAGRVGPAERWIQVIDKRILRIHVKDYGSGTRSRRPRLNLFMAWRDCGLLDERGQSRPAYAVWREYFGRPLDSGQ